MEQLFKYKVDHILFWLLTVGFHAFTKLGIVELAGFDPFLQEVVVRNILLALVVYANLLLIVPLLFNRRQYTYGVISWVLLIAGYVILKNIHDAYVMSQYKIAVDLNLYKLAWYNLSIVIFYVVFSTTLHFTKQWYLQKELIRKIELEKLNTELEYLKAQINPHFLFNSLNTVFFQIDKQNITARETLSKFSDMLRYQLYECNGKEIAIEKELRYITNYVELQRLRKDENYSIALQCSDDLKNFTLPPLLLMPFIENAFKHVSHFNDQKNEIQIKLDRANGLLHLKVYNTKENKPTVTPGGIGLKNVKRRLELLYPEGHKLTVNDHADRFEVELELNVTPA